MAAKIGRRNPVDPRTLSLVSQTTTALPPPTPRPLAALSPLEQALVGHDLPAVTRLLREGADPTEVCAVRLRTAAGDVHEGAACTRLIGVADRMKRMESEPPATRPRAASAMASLRRLRIPTGPLTHLIGRFTPARSSTSASGANAPVTTALRAYDLPAARQALETTGDPPAKFIYKRHQDRLFGMLALNDTERLDAWHKRGLLDPGLQPADRPGMKGLLKAFSYASAKPGRSRSLKLNAKVEFPGRREKVLCRHLATFWLLHRPRLENGKIDYAVFRSKKLLKRAFKSENPYAFDYYVENCTSSHLVENDNWGTFVATQFREMESARPSAEPRRILICSDSHVMASELKIKKDADGRPAYVIDFYDPNVTASHRRLRTQDLASLESLSMAKLINDHRRQARYYENQSVSMAFVISDDMPGVMQADALPRGKERIADRKLSSRPAVRLQTPPIAEAVPHTARDATPVDANQVHHLLKMGFSGEMPRVFAEVSKIPDANAQVHVLRALPSRGGSPLVSAMTVGYENTVSNYTRGVLALTTLSGDQKADLLSQSTKTGPATEMTGLQGALRANRTHVVDAFTRLVLACETLSAEQKLRVLRTRPVAVHGRTRKSKAWPRKSTKAFVDAVNLSDVTPELRARLLQDL